MKVVGNCPKCGNPIYGQRMLAEGEQPTIKRSCACVVITMAAPNPFRAPNVSISQPWQQGFGTITSGSGPPQQAFNTASTYYVLRPPDEDSGMVT